MISTRFRKEIEKASEDYSAIETSVAEGLAVDEKGYLAHFFERRAAADGVNIAQSVLTALVINIVWAALYEASLSIGADLIPVESLVVLKLMLLACSALILLFSIAVVLSILRDNKRTKTRLQIEEHILRKSGLIE